MSDQYVPQKQPSPGPGAYVPGSQPNATQMPPVEPVRSSGGLGSGMLVALVFVVVAVLAAAIFSFNRSTVVPAATGVTIQNNAASAPAATDTTAPAATAPAVTAPATTAPAKAPAPATTAPDATAPAAPSTTAPATAAPAPSATKPDTTTPAVPAPTATAPAAPAKP